MQRFKHILFTASSGEVDLAALKRALKLAERNQAKITILHAIKDLPDHCELASKFKHYLIEHTQTALGKLYQEKVTRIDPKTITVEVSCGEPFIDIIRAVLRHKYDIVFKPAEQHNESLYGFMTVDMHLLRKCPCPLWLYRKNKNKEDNIRLLAPIDPDRQAPKKDRLTRTIMELATSLRIREQNAQLHILNCWEAEYENTLRHSAFLHTSEEEVTQYIDQAKESSSDAYEQALAPFDLDDKQINKHFQKAEAKSYIPTFVKKHRIDTIIMGTVARTGISGLLIGNTAEAILGKVDCSVLAVKPEGFETPVKV